MTKCDWSLENHLLCLQRASHQRNPVGYIVHWWTFTQAIHIYLCWRDVPTMLLFYPTTEGNVHAVYVLVYLFLCDFLDFKDSYVIRFDIHWLPTGQFDLVEHINLTSCNWNLSFVLFIYFFYGSWSYYNGVFNIKHQLGDWALVGWK